jgi:hypothetical protein
VLAVHLVAPIEVSIDVDQGDGLPENLERPQNGDRDTMVPADRDQFRAMGEDFARRRLGPAVVLTVVVTIGRDVAAVDDFDLASVQQGPAQVPVIVIAGVVDIFRSLSQEVRGAALIVGHGPHVVGHPEGHAEDGDIRFQLVQVGDEGKVEECP